MKTLKLILLPLITVSIIAQELDEEFLASLPDDIRKDIQETNQRKADGTAETYRPYVYSSKLKQAETFLKLKDRLESDLLELERRLDFDDSTDANQELVLYGSDFFNTFQTSFMPINEPNPDSGYMLDVGDLLEIQLVGSEEYVEDLLINSDGSISMPDIGKVVIAGLSLNDASQLIKSKVKSTFIGTEAFVSLAEIRDVNILVTGNAEYPGIYTLTGNSNILHAISAAGGISEHGSLREINLIRDNTIIESLDVYDLLILGKYNLKKRLRSGDVVFVESKKSIVTIDGAVNRPAKYEVLENQNLLSIVEYANGITRNADRENISLERILDGSLKTIPVRSENQFETIMAEDGDLIYIREFPYREAKISGAVLKPGFYTMAAGETVNDLIKELINNDQKYELAFEDIKSIRVAVDQKIIQDFNVSIKNAREVAFFPPMTGG